MASSKKAKKKSKKEKKQAELANLSPKEIAALKRKAAQDKKKLINVLSVVVGCLIFISAPLFLIDPKMGLALGAGIPVMYFSYQYPRTGLWLFLIYMPFSGTVIYQVVGGNAIFNLAKDGFFYSCLYCFSPRMQAQKTAAYCQQKNTLYLNISFCCRDFNAFSRQWHDAICLTALF